MVLLSCFIGILCKSFLAAKDVSFEKVQTAVTECEVEGVEVDAC